MLIASESACKAESAMEKVLDILLLLEVINLAAC
jgi:hypothetical protein